MYEYSKGRWAVIHRALSDGSRVYSVLDVEDSPPDEPSLIAAISLDAAIELVDCLDKNAI